jgi:tetratricopeptide (TPR) repeat protein
MQLKRMKSACLSVVMGCVCLCGGISNAWADPCDSLGSNDTWKKGMDKVNAAYLKGDYDTALQHCQALFEICEKSPILNFTMGKIYQAKEDDAKALYYVQRATLYADEYKVGQDTLETMWFERYEAEHPDARPDNLEKLKKENAELKEIVVDNQKTMTKHRFEEMESSYSDLNIYSAGMWTGVAVGSVGLVLTIAGAAMLANGNDDAIDFDNNKAKANVKGAYNAYWTLLGAGIGMTVVGAVFSGFMGYHYARAKKASDDAVSFNLAPTSASLSVRF